MTDDDRDDRLRLMDGPHEAKSSGKDSVCKWCGGDIAIRHWATFRMSAENLYCSEECARNKEHQVLGVIELDDRR